MSWPSCLIVRVLLLLLTSTSRRKCCLTYSTYWRDPWQPYNLCYLLQPSVVIILWHILAKHYCSQAQTHMQRYCIVKFGILIKIKVHVTRLYQQEIHRLPDWMLKCFSVVTDGETVSSTACCCVKRILFICFHDLETWSRVWKKLESLSHVKIEFIYHDILEKKERKEEKEEVGRREGGHKEWKGR